MTQHMTKEEAAAYMRNYRAKKKAEATVTDIATKRRTPDAESGPVETAVRDACIRMPKAVEQPETVAIAIELARVVDTGSPTAQVAASAQLTRILDSLRGGSTRGKLAQLRDGAVRE